MELTPEQLSALEKLRQENKLTLILLHGSQVTEQTHAKSDVDLAVLGLPHAQPDMLKLTTKLGKIIGSDHIDVSDVTHADPLLLYQVTQNAQLLAGDPDELTRLQLSALHRYVDFKPYFKLESELVRQRMASYVTSWY